jgi:hypothetical protein
VLAMPVLRTNSKKNMMASIAIFDEGRLAGIFGNASRGNGTQRTKDGFGDHHKHDLPIAEDALSGRLPCGSMVRMFSCSTITEPRYVCNVSLTMVHFTASGMGPTLTCAQGDIGRLQFVTSRIDDGALQRRIHCITKTKFSITLMENALVGTQYRPVKKTVVAPHRELDEDSGNSTGGSSREAACEEHLGYMEEQCTDVGCCWFHDDTCWSNGGDNPCGSVGGPPTIEQRTEARPNEMESCAASCMQELEALFADGEPVMTVMHTLTTHQQSKQLSAGDALFHRGQQVNVKVFGGPMIIGESEIHAYGERVLMLLHQQGDLKLDVVRGRWRDFVISLLVSIVAFLGIRVVGPWLVCVLHAHLAPKHLLRDPIHSTNPCAQYWHPSGLRHPWWHGTMRVGVLGAFFFLHCLLALPSSCIAFAGAGLQNASAGQYTALGERACFAHQSQFFTG